MKKFLSLVAVFAVVVMFSGVVFAEDDENRYKLTSEADFSSGEISLTVELKNVSDDSAAESITWDTAAILADKNKYHTALVYAEISATLSGNARAILIQSNTEGNDNIYKATTPRTQNMYGTEYSVYSGLVKRNDGATYVPMIYKITTEKSAPTFTDIGQQIRFVIDEKDSMINRTNGELDPTPAQFNYVTIADSDGLAYADDFTDATHYHHLASDNGYIYFGGQFANITSGSKFGTNRLIMQVVNE